jgi:hypothetical protein
MSSPRKSLTDASTAAAKAQSRGARKLNDSLVYLDGPQIYTCAQCRTHLTSHDEIISKSFHGRHGKPGCTRMSETQHSFSHTLTPVVLSPFRPCVSL